MFEYDPAKSAANKRKHGIDFDEAQMLWLDERRIEAEARQSVSEPRSLVIGTAFGKVWTAIVTRRGDAVRIISVRRARQTEQAVYDDG